MCTKCQTCKCPKENINIEDNTKIHGFLKFDVEEVVSITVIYSGTERREQNHKLELQHPLAGETFKTHRFLDCSVLQLHIIQQILERRYSSLCFVDPSCLHTCQALHGSHI
jgi:hypothetical protein